jgi:hypothetical protein
MASDTCVVRARRASPPFLIIGIVGLIVSLVAATTSTAVTPPPSAPLAITAPPGWVATSGVEAGRNDVYWAAAQNKSMDPEAISRTRAYRDYSPWKDVAPDRVLVRIGTAFGPPATGVPADSSFPLDWSKAERLANDWSFEVWELPLVYAGVPYAVVAHIGTNASPIDRVAVRAVIAAIRPDR